MDVEGVRSRRESADPSLDQHPARTLREADRAHLLAVRAAHHRRGGLPNDIMVDSLGDAQRAAGVPLPFGGVRREESLFRQMPRPQRCP